MLSSSRTNEIRKGSDLFEDNDFVGVHNRCEAMGNGNDSVILKHCSNCLLNEGIYHVRVCQVNMDMVYV